MGYSDNPASVRVDFFKESGKWYCTEAVEWCGYDAALIHDAFRDSLRIHLTQEDGRIRLEEMTAVCLEPYHEHAHPLMMRVRAIKEQQP